MGSLEWGYPFLFNLLAQLRYLLTKLSTRINASL